jgi:hypothetical protein
MSKFDDKSKNIQRAQSPRLGTEENNDVTDKKFLDAGDNVNAELQTTGPGSGVDGVEKSATQKNSQPRHSSGAVGERAKVSLSFSNSGTGSATFCNSFCNRS